MYHEQYQPQPYSQHCQPEHYQPLSAEPREPYEPAAVRITDRRTLIPIVLLQILSAVAAGGAILLLIAGTPSYAVPRFEFANIQLSDLAIQARQDISPPVSQPDARVFLLYLNSYCTASYQSDDYIYNIADNNNNSRNVSDTLRIDYSSLTCYNHSLAFAFNYQAQFGINHTCVRRCQEKLTRTTHRLNNQYLASLVFLFLLLFWNFGIFIANTEKPRRWYRLISLLLSIPTFAMLVNSLSGIVSLHKPVKNGFFHCFEPYVRVNKGQLALNIVTVGLVVISLVILILSVMMAAFSEDGRWYYQYRYRKNRRKDDSGNGGCGDGGGSGGDGGGNSGGGDGGGC